MTTQNTKTRGFCRTAAVVLAAAVGAGGCDDAGSGRGGATAVGDPPPGSGGGKADDLSGFEIEVIVNHGRDGDPAACFTVAELEAVRDNFVMRGQVTQDMPALQNLAIGLREIRHYVSRRADRQGNMNGRDMLDCTVGGATVVFLGRAFGLTSLFRNAYEQSYVGRLFFNTQALFDEDATILQRTSLTTDTAEYKNGPCTEQWRDAFCDESDNQIFHTWFFVALTYSAPEQDFASALTGFANAGHEWGLMDDCWFNEDYGSGGCSVADWDASRWGAIHGMVLRAARDHGAPDDDEAALGAFEQFVELTGGMLAEPSESEQTCNLVNHSSIGDASGRDVYGEIIIDDADCEAWATMNAIVTEEFDVGLFGDFGTKLQRVGMHIMVTLESFTGLLAGVWCDSVGGWLNLCD